MPLILLTLQEVYNSSTHASKRVAQKVMLFFSWSLTKLGMWDFRWYKFEVPGSYILNCEDFWQTAPLQQHFKFETVYDEHYKQRTVIEFLVPEKESVGNTHKQLHNLYESATVDRNTTGCWARKVTAFETRKAELHDSCSDNLAMWAGQGVVLTKHTHTYSLLVQGHRNGRRLCGKTRYGNKPSLFIMYNFQDLGIHIYGEEKYGALLPRQPS
jgi:hypothetical protein